VQQTAVNLLKIFGSPSDSWNFYTSHIVVLDLFCCHCRRRSYLSGIGLLQLCRVIWRSVNKVVSVYRNGREKINWRRKPSVKFWFLTPYSE